ncbi:MAG: NUDIX domain-containing protein, partial [Lachnospiraceae bacterium]|nr:NUDIX domain-containing protein [Lachnospiraceae bacterium]
MKDIIARYRENYIVEMRKDVGHAPLMVTSCGVIIENEKGEILLQKRRDNECWALIGGSMEIGEKFIEVVKREALEEAGIEIGELTLFGIYSGEDGII